MRECSPGLRRVSYLPRAAATSWRCSRGPGHQGETAPAGGARGQRGRARRGHHHRRGLVPPGRAAGRSRRPEGV